MPFTKQINKDFYIKDNRIYLSDEYFNKNRKYFKKITGSRFASILNLNQFTSPVQAWCTIVNIYRDEMDPTLAKVGTIIEPKIRDYVSKITNIKFKIYNPSEVNWNVFDDDVFGGIPDGEPVDETDKFIYDKDFPMLEIKTSSEDKLTYEKINGVFRLKKDKNNYPIVKEVGKKKESWFINNQFKVPDEYCLQLILYLYLRKVNNGMFAVAFLKPQDYVYPEKFDVTKREIHFAKLNIRDFKNLQNTINYAREWYKLYVMDKHYSMPLDECDKKWIAEELGINVN
ncbi:MAG: YqaJ viral recombinase family protein [Mycoplasma sp.]|nr:YqaJ viral recombinase family protein [Mycoplasma sp.]